jgi:hypothetical protein
MLFGRGFFLSFLILYTPTLKAYEVVDSFQSGVLSSKWNTPNTSDEAWGISSAHSYDDLYSLKSGSITHWTSHTLLDTQ